VKRALLGFFSFLLIASLAHGRGLVLENIRYWTAPDHTRVVVDLTGPPDYAHRALTEPFRIAVDVRKAEFRGSTRKISVGDGLLQAIRMNSLRSGTAQVVLDLERIPRYHVFHLSPVAGKPNRIVIDLFRDKDEKPRPAPPPEEKIRTIVIDPGHGGEDPGAKGLFGLVEKELTLDVGRKLARKVDALPGYRALLTRKGDYFLSLRKRGLFARENSGDLFVSLHANSARSSSAQGFEVFFLSLSGATDKMARELADKENAADLVGGVPPDAEDTVLSILFDYLQEEGMRRSEVLAECVYNSFRGGQELRLRNVKQAGFAVLKSMEIPAVLVELGFLSNRHDASLLKDSAYRDRLAQNLLDGIVAYFGRMDADTVQFHVVQKGETAWSIADQYEVSVGELLEANNLKPDSVLRVGQRIRVR